jgi:hypothetical protein
MVLCQPGGLLRGDCRIPVVEDDLADSQATSHDPVRLGRSLARLAGDRATGGQA